MHDDEDDDEDDDDNNSCPDDNVSGHLGFSITFDNVDKKIHARHHTRDHQNTMHNMVQGYAAKDRVPTMHLQDDPPTCDTIKEIPIYKYVPNKDDILSLRSEYDIIIRRIISSKMKVFNSFESRVPKHIPHEFSKESTAKSEIVLLGVLDKNESNISDMIDIMEHYHTYVPQRNDRPLNTILYGDGLSCERANDARNARIHAADPYSRLEGLEPAAQEWHKRGIILQDTYDTLYSPSTSRDPGTLYHIRNTYMHKQVKKNVLHCFDHATELLRFATEGYVIAAACKFLGIEDPSQMISPVPSPDSLNTMFESVCQYTLSLAFHPPNISKTLSEIYEDSSDDVHLSQLCICGGDILSTTTDMIGCCNPYCERQWFHIECISLTDQPVENWFCCDACKEMHSNMNSQQDAGGIDHQFEYTKALLWRGIGEMARHDASRENDGKRMIMHWRLDMCDFMNMNHPKYFVLGFRLLTSVSGGSSERMAKQLTWNRTVNILGGQAKNIEMDLHMEHMNRDYKESIKSYGGQLTEDTIARHSQMVGIGRVFESKFDECVSLRRSDRRKHGKAKREEDTRHLVKTLLEKKCFDNVAYRCHIGYPQFILNTDISNTLAFKKRILNNKKKMINKISMIANP